jgi:hypothetical protein
VLWSRGRSGAPTTAGSALKSADQRAALSQLSARGSGPLLILAPHPDRRSAGALTLYPSIYPPMRPILPFRIRLVKRLSKILLVIWIISDMMPVSTVRWLNGEIQMVDEHTVNPEQDAAPQTKLKQTRQRSSVPFAYVDLQGVMEVATAIHAHVGSGECDEHQLAVWLNKSPKSSGFRILLSTARMFGLMETDGTGNSKLTSLGRMAVDPTQAREARAKAFLTVPLYSAVFEHYKGGVLPPAAALERELVQIGVAEKQKHTARLVMERSAQYAGFCEHGKDRLVMPGVSPNARKDALPPEGSSQDGGGGGKGGDGGGDGEKPRHPFIEGLLKTLPDPEADEEWPLDKRVKWLQTAANIFDLIYKGEGGIKVEPAMAQRSPRPHE